MSKTFLIYHGYYLNIDFMLKNNGIFNNHDKYFRHSFERKINLNIHRNMKNIPKTDIETIRNIDTDARIQKHRKHRQYILCSNEYLKYSVDKSRNISMHSLKLESVPSFKRCF